MKRRPLRAAIGAVLVAIPIFPIPGLAGRSLSVGGDARTSTGGAIIAATVNGAASGASSRVAITRLDADGTVDLAYGARGITQAGLAAGARATAVAINPATGAAWVGVRTPAGASEIVALDGSGARGTTFGQAGVARLLSLGAPTALAWRHGELIAAAGTRVAVLDPTSGIVKRMLAIPAGTAGCAVTAITSAAFVGAAAMLGTVVGGPSRCSAPILRVTSLGSSDQPFVRARSVTLAGGGANLCIAASSAQSTTIGPAAAVKAPAGRLIALASLGAGACAALIDPAGAGHAVVVQSARDNNRVTTMLPGKIQPLAITRCNQHLLVIGDEPSGGTRNGVVAVVPVREGPFAASAPTAAARTPAARTPAARTAAAEVAAGGPTPSAATCRSA